MELITQMFVPKTIEALLEKPEWASYLFGLVQRRRKNLHKALEEINAVTFGDPLELSKRYIEPRCQEINPANREEDDFLVSREPAFKKVSQFFAAPTRQLGSNQLFVLSDAGMGKTSLLAMLKLMHINSIWPSRLGCEIFKLAPDTLDVIARRIANTNDSPDHISPPNTILLLDSLDEDPSAYGKTEERLLSILAATQRFYKVIITCRTQFFPVVQRDPLERPGIVVVGGYTCPTKYLANFDDSLVERYLRKVFPMSIRFIVRSERIRRANEVIKAMGSLRCRPMLLAHIEDLVDSPLVAGKLPSDFKSGSGMASRLIEFEVYRALVSAWLNREQAKHGIDAAKLGRACEGIAAAMLYKQKRAISADELKEIAKQVPDALEVEALELQGRSLLNRTAEGYYRFSHFSIQEFLVVKCVMEGTLPRDCTPVRGTSLMATMVFELVFDPRREGLRQNFGAITFKEADLRNVNLSARDLSGLSIQGMTFDNADFSASSLRDAKFDKCSFKTCRFCSADLSSASFVDCDMSGASFHGATMNAATISHCIMDRTDMMMVDLTGATITGSSFSGASNLGWCSLRDAKLSSVEFGASDWTGPNYRLLELRSWGSYDGVTVQLFGGRKLHCEIKDIETYEGCNGWPPGNLPK
jgi:uncharacterized protein YjbI with pentapeptide repeats